MGGRVVVHSNISLKNNNALLNICYRRICQKNALLNQNNDCATWYCLAQRYTAQRGLREKQNGLKVFQGRPLCIAMTEMFLFCFLFFRCVSSSRLLLVCNVLCIGSNHIYFLPGGQRRTHSAAPLKLVKRKKEREETPKDFRGWTQASRTKIKNN